MHTNAVANGDAKNNQVGLELGMTNLQWVVLFAWIWNSPYQIG